MLNSEKEFLSLFGWDGFFESQIANIILQTVLHTVLQNLVPARVICEERNLYRVQLGINHVLWASVSGKMQFNAATQIDYPAVGDWVLVEAHEQSERAVIHHIVPRKTMSQRKQVGSSYEL